ncbi:MAG: hypothetical protein KC416_03480 [Myxococcales bacterium]|nr:hypothetical protein [Myxococcales bacterium]
MGPPSKASGHRDEGGSPYAGRHAETRLEPIPVRIGDQTVVVELHTVVNVVTHPDLGRVAREGRLHGAMGRVALAVPYVYHDPGTRCFALVLPEALAPRELKERAQLLMDLAEDGPPVPAYVKEARVVVGQGGLLAYLEGRLSGPDLDFPDSAIEVEEGDLDSLEDLAPEDVLDADSEEEFVDEPSLRARAAGFRDAVGDDSDDDAIRISTVDLETVEEDEEPMRVSTSDLMEDQLYAGTWEAATQEVTLSGAFVEDITDKVNPAPGVSALRSAPGAEMIAVAEGGRVRLFVRLSEGLEGSFSSEGSEMDLLVQLVEVQGYPVVILALVEFAAPRPLVRRTALDPRHTTDRAILSVLEHRFEVEVALVTSDGAYQRGFVLRAPREPNVSRILERIGSSGSTEEEGEGGVVALERALAAPPPAGVSGHPFADRRSVLAPSALVAALEPLEKWVAAEQRDRAVLVLGVPEGDVDLVFRWRLEQALELGLPLTPGLLQEAIALGLVADPRDFVRTALKNFPSTVASGDLQTDAARLYEELLTLATLQDVPVPTGMEDGAWRTILNTKVSASHRPTLENVAAEDLADLSPDLLSAVLYHPRLRGEAIREFCSRPPDQHAVEVCLALRRLSDRELAGVGPLVAALGDRAADGLLQLLEDDRAMVRLAAALTLERLHLRRAVVPLVRLLQGEKEPFWREYARILGSFGDQAFRSLSRSFKDPVGQEERFAHALAHLANQGCESSLAQVLRSEDRRLQQLAERASTLREQVRHGDGVDDATTPDEGFSSRFRRGLDALAEEAM